MTPAPSWLLLGVALAATGTAVLLAPRLWAWALDWVNRCLDSDTWVCDGCGAHRDTVPYAPDDTTFLCPACATQWQARLVVDGAVAQAQAHVDQCARRDPSLARGFAANDWRAARTDRSDR